MKKYLILLIMIIFPNMVNALACDFNLVTEYKSIASNVTYDMHFDEETETFTIDFYNLRDTMYINHGGKNYNLELDEFLDFSKASVIGIKQGTSQSFEIRKNISFCDDLLRRITISTPHYNPHFRDSKCDDNKEYELCNRFLSFKIDVNYFNKSIDNYIKLKENISEEPIVPREETNYFLQIISSPYLYFSIILITTSLIIYIYIKEKREDLF
jgi:hypothetical protein